SHFFAGTTDLRGVFVAEGVHGVVTAVARQGTHRYAFYRGKQFVGTPPMPDRPPAPNGPQQGQAQPPSAGENSPAQNGAGMSLEQNIRALNSSNQLHQIERLQQRYAPDQGKGVPASVAP
ncbi:MAG TPA: hypothetical protein VG406_02595, partial [Isosphaeraceae bacterium]|nr:hypothetical protein [Isosphaeraceae bacterium]